MQFSFLKKRDVVVISLFLLCISILIFSITNPILPAERQSISFNAASHVKLQEHVYFLSSLEPPRSYHNYEMLNKSAAYIHDELTQYCDNVEEQIFEVQNKEYKNIVCSFNVTNANRIIVGAHYDAFSLTPGADDNASGIAGMMELARMFAENGTPDKRIDLVAYTLEEPPFFRSDDMGSYHHSESVAGEQIKLVIVLEMIGYFSEEEQSQEFPTALLKPFYPSTGNFIAVVSKFGLGSEVRRVKKYMKEIMDTGVYSISAPASMPGIDFSDHMSYWRNDIPALMITDTSFYRNKNYHTKHDTADTLNYSKMADVVNGVYWTVVNY